MNKKHIFKYFCEREDPKLDVGHTCRPAEQQLSVSYYEGHYNMLEWIYVWLEHISLKKNGQPSAFIS